MQLKKRKDANENTFNCNYKRRIMIIILFSRNKKDSSEAIKQINRI